MGSSMMKTTLREIRQSLGRYLAIMAIVALGVGLFCGLKVTRDVMVKSAQQYFEERQLYDISLLSTVGSSHSSNLGFFARARAIATICCSPPESCAGKLDIRSFSPTASKTDAAGSGSLQICAANSTFSKAVRFCTRL